MKIAGIVLGVLLLVNPYIPFLGEHTRVLDLLPALLICFLLFIAFDNLPGDARFFWAAGIVAIAEIPWLIRDWGDLGFLAPVYSTRWLLLLPLGLTLCLLQRRKVFLISFAWGILFGAGLNAALLSLQWLGFTDLLVRIGLAYPDPADLRIGDAIRFSGLHGHPNGAAAVVSLATPAAISLVSESEGSPLLIPLSFVICLVGALCTYSRSPFIVAGVLFAMWMLFSKRNKSTGMALVAICVVGSFVIGIAAPALSERFTGDKFTERNAEYRWETTSESLFLVAHNPLGLGSNFHQYVLSDSTHNGFTALALYGGWTIAFLVIVGIVYHAALTKRTVSLQGWLAAQLIGLCFFEEHFSNPTFIGLALWLTCSWLATLGAASPAVSSTRAAVRTAYVQ
jgi:hypothetical protein